MPLLTAQDVAIERGERRLLSGVHLTVEAGDIWQLVGANGVGKTSLLRAWRVWRSWVSLARLCMRKHGFIWGMPPH